MSYCYSYDEEHFHGAYETRQDAFEEARDMDPEAEDVFIGESVKPAKFLSRSRLGNRIFEHLCDQLGEEVGEASENFQMTGDQMERLGRYVIDWIDRNVPGGFGCWGVRNVKHMQVSRAIACTCGPLCSPNCSGSCGCTYCRTNYGPQS